jgi:two-component system, sensor histidine kinase and response regulator
MKQIIDSLLMLANVRQQSDVKLQRLNMAAIIQNVRERLDPMIDYQKIALSMPTNWPDVLGNALWIEEVWINYLTNAIKYGGVPAQIELGYDALTDGTIRFWVRDNGPGIDPEQQHRLFQPFSRLDNPTIQGHGLGLSIVKRIVERLGGSVGVESSPGQGSKFWFTLLTR